MARSEEINKPVSMSNPESPMEEKKVLPTPETPTRTRGNNPMLPPQAPSGTSQGTDTEQQDASQEVFEDDGEQPLPFSKARCIALVTTVAGASFVNVCICLFHAPRYSALVFLAPTYNEHSTSND
jgi:hypothetical protein